MPENGDYRDRSLEGAPEQANKPKKFGRGARLRALRPASNQEFAIAKQLEEGEGGGARLGFKPSAARGG